MRPGEEGRADATAAIQQEIGRWQVRRLAVRVLLVQVIALTALWLLQITFGSA